MKLTELLLIQLIEECAEVIHRATKQLRFGEDEIQPGQELTNKIRLEMELTDLQTLIGMCREENIIPLFDITKFSECVNAKQNKVRKFLMYSSQLGILKD